MKEASRASASGGSGSSRVDPAPIEPHRRPSTTTGVPISERMPIARMRSASEPVAPAWFSTRAVRPVSNYVSDDVLSVHGPPATNGNEVHSPAPAGNVEERTVRLKARHARHIDRNQPRELIGDRREHLLRRRPARHQRRNPPQRGLLLSQPSESGTALGVGDRGRHQLGEGGQARLGIGRQLLVSGVGHQDQAPRPPLDADRHAHPRAGTPVVSASVPDAARDVGVGVQPGGPASPQRQRAHVPAADLEPAADRARRGGAGGSPRAGDRDHVRRIEPDQDRLVDLQQPADLLGDRREHLLRRSRLGYQRRHPPQRGLRLGKLPQPCLVGWIAAPPAVGGRTRADGLIWRVHMTDGSPVPGGAATFEAGPVPDPGVRGTAAMRGVSTRSLPVDVAQP